MKSSWSNKTKVLALLASSKLGASFIEPEITSAWAKSSAQFRLIYGAYVIRTNDSLYLIIEYEA